MKTWRIIDIINWGTQYFKSKGIDEARLTIELMLCHILNCRRVDLYVDFERPLSKSEIETLKEMIKRRLKKEPLQYILGETEFMGIKFKVTPDVLIPRPETEILVEKAIETINKNFTTSEVVKVLDIGTGSGNIAISIAKFLGDKVFVTGIDLSEKAIEVARENSISNDVKNINFLIADIFDDNLFDRLGGKFNIAVSNPPYIPGDELDKLQEEVKNFEPLIALTDGNDGLKFYRRIADIGRDIIYDGGHIIVEMSYGQSEKVIDIFKSRGYEKIEIFKDYLGIERVAKIKVNLK
ncbi:release factor glutamine methyltransferase [Candidatus Thermokryptus mobilis]|uniref:Release factor glutamine methyltransferase n=2 Tax=Candidatus Thermokryptus mobilis TaxID=1643428 RepID=A0A0S4MW00_9BACT|nr:release factor glutamine methyltransferase [Candidatus Thermokryptus mobilis]